MARYRDEQRAVRAGSWPSFLAAHATGTPRRFEPRPAAAATFDRMYARHRRLVALHGQLEAAVGAHG
jgi:hypothetical protein